MGTVTREPPPKHGVVSLRVTHMLRPSPSSETDKYSRTPIRTERSDAGTQIRYTTAFLYLCVRSNYSLATAPSLNTIYAHKESWTP